MKSLLMGLVVALAAGRSSPPPPCPPIGPGPVIFPPPYKPGPRFDPSYVNFTIATRKSPQPIPLDPDNLKGVKNKKTIIVIGGWEYGWEFSEPSSYFSDVTKAYLSKSDYNVISVNDYPLMNVSLNESITYTEPIGRCVADLIISLYRQNKVALSKIHIVGHGLGSHIGGAAGCIVSKSLNKKIYRITALEILSSVLENASPKRQLDKADAEVVDVIHTVTENSLGSADFFVNPNSLKQPGCCFALDAGVCEFNSSILYFINTLQLYIEALKCDSVKDFAKSKCNGSETAIFGDNYKGYPKGKFYLYLY